MDEVLALLHAHAAVPWSRPLALSVHVDRSATSQSISKIIELDKPLVDPMPAIVAPPNSAPKQSACYGSTGN